MSLFNSRDDLLKNPDILEQWGCISSAARNFHTQPDGNFHIKMTASEAQFVWNGSGWATTELRPYHDILGHGGAYFLVPIKWDEVRPSTHLGEIITRIPRHRLVSDFSWETLVKELDARDKVFKTQLSPQEREEVLGLAETIFDSLLVTDQCWSNFEKLALNALESGEMTASILPVNESLHQSVLSLAAFCPRLAE